MDLEPESTLSFSRRECAEIRLRVAETNATALLQATNAAETEMDLVQDLLARCKSDKRNIQMYLNNALEAAEEAVDNVEELFAVMDSINVAIEMAETVSTPTPADAEQLSCPRIDTIIENRDVFSLICMLRSNIEEVQTKAALGLLEFARESEQMQNEIRSSGGLPAALVLFRSSTKLKVVAGIIAALLVIPSSMPAENPLAYVLRIADCLRPLGKTTVRSLAGLNDTNTNTQTAITRGDTIEAAINGLTILWEFVIEFNVIQDQSTSHTGPLEAQLEKHSEDQVKLELCLVKASVNGWGEKEMETAQKLLEDSFDDIESFIGAIQVSSVFEHEETTLSVPLESPLEGGTTSTDATSHEEPMDSLIDRRDVFSLLCMLRANSERRTIAALTLLQFVKEEEELRSEILSCGGLDALVILFRRKHVSTEVKVVACMTIAHLIPSTAIAVQVNPSNACSMVDCLQFLVSGTTEATITVRDTTITREMMMQAATNGFYLLWTQIIEPLILVGPTHPRVSDASSINPASVDSLTVAVGGAQVGCDSDDDEEEKETNQEDVERQQLMEAALNLMAQLNVDPTGSYTAALRHHLDGTGSSYQESTLGQ